MARISEAILCVSIPLRLCVKKSTDLTQSCVSIGPKYRALSLPRQMNLSHHTACAATAIFLNYIQRCMHDRIEGG